MKYDFSGWATKYNVQCTDGRTIRPGAFKSQHGAKVPLVWGHVHDDLTAVLGHAYLEDRDEGVYTYGVFNTDTEQGRNAKELVEHEDLDSLSICANRLEPKHAKPPCDILHGHIREISLVLSGANEGAHIDTVIKHGDDETSSEEVSELIVYNDEYIEINHGDAEIPENLIHEEKGDTPVATEDIQHKENDASDGDETVEDILNTMNEKQQKVVAYLMDEAAKAALAEAKHDDNDDEEESHEMHHNIFDTESAAPSANCLTHSDFEAIKARVKRCGSWKEAYKDRLDELRHDDEPADPATPTVYTDRQGNTIDYNRDADGNPYFIGNYGLMFPDYQLVGEKPAMIERDTVWVSKVVNAAKHSPFNRIKTLAADITEDDARAKGYIKGKRKKEEFFSLMKRTTSATTIYKKQKMDRDDEIDITDWPVVAWLKGEMRKMLDEEVARAALIGDGRLPSDDDHINPDCIRPVAYDDDLFTVKVTLPDPTDDSVSTGDKAKDFIRSVIANRKLYKGSGNPTLFTTEDMLTEMLLITDEIGRDLYDSVQKLATKLRVKEIVTVPVLENNADKIVGILVNMQDYTFGSTKGGAVSMFEDFDIDVNQKKYLIETRLCGCLTKPFSAMVFKEYSAASEDDGE